MKMNFKIPLRKDQNFSRIQLLFVFFVKLFIYFTCILIIITRNKQNSQFSAIFSYFFHKHKLYS